MVDEVGAGRKIVLTNKVLSGRSLNSQGTGIGGTRGWGGPGGARGGREECVVGLLRGGGCNRLVRT